MNSTLLKCIIVICTLFCTYIVDAQERVTLGGKVINDSGEILNGAVVSCIELPDSVIVTYSIVDGNGIFKIDGDVRKVDNVFLGVSFLGYDKKYVKPTGEEMIITLSQCNTLLKEVTVKASAQSLVQKPGKYVFTPGVLEAASMDSYDLLRFTPLMTLENNVISILGKGRSTIYINIYQWT